MLDILAAISLLLAIGCIAATIYYLRVVVIMCAKLATDCVHMKLLLQLMAKHMADHGVVRVEHMADDERQKMN